jgi:hypothetical protein
VNTIAFQVNPMVWIADDNAVDLDTSGLDPLPRLRA